MGTTMAVQLVGWKRAEVLLADHLEAPICAHRRGRVTFSDNNIIVTSIIVVAFVDAVA